MTSLNQILALIEESTENINRLGRPQPGIFTNGVLKGPSINALIEDTIGDEGDLFEIRDNSAARKDGLLVLVQNYNEKCMVPIPSVNASIKTNIDVPPKQVLIDDSLSFPAITSKAYQLLDKYPTLIDNHDHLLQKLNSLVAEHSSLQSSIQSQELKLKLQNDELDNRRDMSLSPRKLHNDELELDRLIKTEQEEIKQLEAQLEKMDNQFH